VRQRRRQQSRYRLVVHHQPVHVAVRLVLVRRDQHPVQPVQQQPVQLLVELDGEEGLGQRRRVVLELELDPELLEPERLRRQRRVLVLALEQRQLVDAPGCEPGSAEVREQHDEVSPRQGIWESRCGMPQRLFLF
jgi:hypothetical protein